MQKILINASEVPNIKGHFEFEIGLVEAQLNTVMIEVTDSVGNKITKTLNIYQGTMPTASSKYKTKKGDLILTSSKIGSLVTLSWTPTTLPSTAFKAYYVVIGKKSNTDPFYSDGKDGTQSYPIYSILTNSFEYSFDTNETFNFRICATIKNESLTDLYCSEKILTLTHP